MIQKNLVVIFFYLASISIVQTVIDPLQQWIITNDSALNASWIFLPHGVRVLSVLLLGYICFPGLWIAAFLYGLLYLSASGNEIVLLITSLLSAIAVMIAYRFYFVRTIPNLDDITLKNILKLSVSISIISSLLINFFRWMIGETLELQEILRQTLLYFIGDNIGAIVFFLLIINIKKFLLRHAK